VKTTIQKVANRALGGNLVGLAVLALTGQLADGDLLVLDGVTYEADDDATVTAGNVIVDITGNGSVADDFDDIVAAVKANQGNDFRAIDGTTYAAFISRKPAPFDTTATVAAGSTLREVNPDQPANDVNFAVMASRAATAAEVTQGLAVFAFGRTPTAILVQVRTAAGAFKAYDGIGTIDGEIVTLDNAGSADFADTDVLTVLASF
jgi:hypothetical protein